MRLAFSAQPYHAKKEYAASKDDRKTPEQPKRRISFKCLNHHEQVNDRRTILIGVNMEIAVGGLLQFGRWESILDLS